LNDKTGILELGPFSGIDISLFNKLDAITISNSNEDFLLVLDGKKPKHAVLNEVAAPALDGSTTSYLGNRYELVVIQSPSTFGGIHGYIYGPIITYERKFAPGNMTTVNYLRFYTTDQLSNLQSE